MWVGTWLYQLMTTGPGGPDRIQVWDVDTGVTLPLQPPAHQVHTRAVLSADLCLCDHITLWLSGAGMLLHEAVAASVKYDE